MIGTENGGRSIPGQGEQYARQKGFRRVTDRTVKGRQGTLDNAHAEFALSTFCPINEIRGSPDFNSTVTRNHTPATPSIQVQR
jgi:hypothetical protein